MELLSSPPSAFPGNALLLVQQWRLCKWRNCTRFGLDVRLLRSTFYRKNSRSGDGCFPRRRDIPISCSAGIIDKHSFVHSTEKLANARVIYAVAPAMGHNQESHPESHLKSPFNCQCSRKDGAHSDEIIELRNFKPASVDEIASVHSRNYETGLGKAMDRASEQGLNFIEGSGLTYATANTFQDSLVAAGAGIALVDSLDGSYPGTDKFDQIGRGDGERTTLNLPLPGGSGDIAMRTVFDEVIVPCAQKFKPDIILVSAGYDAHVPDPLANLQFTTGTYYMLASYIQQLAKDLCSGRCVFFLEGGCNLDSLSYSVADSFRAFLGEPSLAMEFDNPGILHEEPLSKVKRAIEKVKHLHTL